MTPTKPNMRELEAQARASAIAHITNMFQRPGQLEKIEQVKRHLTRKKNSVEALLKSAMQQQLDGVRSGLNQLHACLEDVKEINASMKKISLLFEQVPELCEDLSTVRDENMRHSQYVTARENLKHIFTVPESVEKTKQWINDGKLLHAHQCLRDLENSRDELLYELHKLPNQSPHDKSMLKAYFSDVEILSNLLEKQLRLVMSRTLNTVRKEPTVIVTALRIIEREEKSDFEILKQEKQTGFLPPGRPKKWKVMAFQVLEKAVATRIEGTQVEERDDDKHWLIRYLELIRQLILEDLRVVKTLCTPCFPVRYEIIDKYIEMYHNSLSLHLQEIIQNGLEGNEYVTILSWVAKTYRGVEMLAHPDLIEHTNKLGKLLPDAVLNSLETDYLKNIEKNYTDWLRNTLNAEEQEWLSNVEPGDNLSRTAAPIIIFQMIDQNLQVSKTISEDLTVKVLNLSIHQVILYSNLYKTAITAFKNKYFEDRKQVPYFTQCIILIVNNCLQLSDLGAQLEKQYWTPASPQFLGENFTKLRSTFIQLRNDSADYLLEELFLDLDKHFDELFNSKWIQSSLAVDTICATLDDYFQDYNKLAEQNFKFIVHQARLLVTKRYLTALLSRRTTFKTFEECVQAAGKIAKESDQLSKLLDNFAPAAENDDPFDCFHVLAEVLKSDNDMLSFELHRLVEKYPDVSEDVLLRLLGLRGDLAKSEVRDKVAHVPKVKGTYQSSMFRNLVFPKFANLNVFN